MISFCKETNLFILNGRTQSDPLGQFTFSFHDKASLIDYALVSEHFLNNQGIDLEIQPFVFSSHLAVDVSLPLAVARTPPDSSATLCRLPGKIVIQSDLDKEKLDDRFNRYFPLFFDGFLFCIEKGKIEDAAPMLNEFLALLGRPFTKRTPSNNRKKAWYDSVCKSARNRVRATWRSYCNGTSRVRLKIYSIARLTYRKIVNKAKKTHVQKQKETLLRAVKEKNLSLIWDSLKHSKRQSSNVPSSISPDMWISHFGKTMNHTIAPRPEWEVRTGELPDVPELDAEIEEQDIFNAMKKIKSGKSPGFDGFSGSYLKAINDRLPVLLKPLFNALLNQGHFPSIWSKALIHPLYKNAGRRNDPGNYRGIALLSHVGKLFARIIYNRLSSWAEANSLISDVQGGFRSGRETLENLLVLDTLINDTINCKKGRLYVCLVDKAKAFDFTQRPAVLKRLADMGVSRKLFLVLQSMFSNSSFGVKLSPSHCSEFASSTSGIFQGCIVSPLLFILFLNVLSEELDATDNCDAPRLLDRKVNHLYWADDLIICSKSVAGLQRLLSKLENLCSLWGLEINQAKTKVIIFKKGRQSVLPFENWSLNNKLLEVVRESKYLGLIWSYNLKWNSHI